MLAQLRLVLSKVSVRFTLEPFPTFDLIKLSPDEITQKLMTEENRSKIDGFLNDFAEYCI